MVLSMTGYGRGLLEEESYQVTAEIRSVNHRFLEVSVSLPDSLMTYEDKIRRFIKQYIQRGKVDVFISVAGMEADAKDLRVDWDLVAQYVESLHEMGKRFDGFSAFSLGDLLRIPGVFTVVEKDVHTEQLETLLFKATEGALRKLIEMRTYEGRSLFEDLQKRLDQLESAIHFLIEHAPEVVEIYRNRLRENMSAFLSNTDIDEIRLMNEVAVFADKINIEEELTRLKSHLGQFRKYLSENGALGKKLNFLLQEMNREMNTIGAKGNHFDTSVKIVEMKSELENMREQVQNVE